MSRLNRKVAKLVSRRQCGLWGGIINVTDKEICPIQRARRTLAYFPNGDIGAFQVESGNPGCKESNCAQRPQVHIAITSQSNALAV
jgi:hypothetical protein